MKRDPTKRDCRRALCRLYNLALADKISASKAARLAYIAQIVLRSLEADEQRWATAETAPSPEQMAAQIRTAMREADAQIPPPPEAE